MGILDTPPDERVDRVTRLAKEMFSVPMVSVNLLDNARLWSKSQIGFRGSEMPREYSFCDNTVRQDRTVVIEDVSIDPMFARNPFVLGDPHLRFYAGHPLHAPGGEAIGTLCILDTQPRQFTESQSSLLKDLAFWVQAELSRDQELDHARVIQRAMSPQRHPSVPGYTLAAGAFSRGKLSGDFYDLMLRGDALRVTLADAMGKGAGPALVAAGVRASLRTAPERSLAAAIAEADLLVEEDMGDMGMFVTAVHADIFPATGRVELIDAGHGLAFIIRADGGRQHLRSYGLPLGMGTGTVEEHERITGRLAPGDTFICCSDGLLDVLDPDDPFGQVERAIRELGPEGTVDEALRLARGERATDDITALVIRRDR
ncbi:MULTISPECIES: SpoIIE family protein phosphatase [Arthrobacter]|uniref:GAF domain-containing SpoIIE family protein phosphatase n=2 Tax=Arthrobacter TaxID=1663 RepID=A0ABU9KNY8_9MICC|nr:SpoIIE family protein phosphatase [Arthrobacter sp. YJM1]MDP5228521.1 SpoIIE family protein phosphatase [Arthrobacter sp. YJM1]